MGKKYIIEIEEKPFEKPDPDVFAREDRWISPEYPFEKERLYRVVGFPTMVFTQTGLDELTPLTKETVADLV